MKISNQIELSQFNVRNVSQKQIYDSYMGILRISPITMYGRDNDDPTPLLNTLVDFNDVFGCGKNNHTYATLSDSDGNVLPIKFIPKSFNTQVFDGEIYQIGDLINICTQVDNCVYVSNNLTSKSTIILSNPQENKSQIIIAQGVDRVSGKTESIVAYPIEAPDDYKFFNDKNKLELFDQNNSTPRHKQMEQALFNKPNSWYHEKDLWYRNDEDPSHINQQVKVGNRVITTVNKDNESVPVLYTRDYVLGHYDGHTWGHTSAGDREKITSLIKETSSHGIELDENGRITKLSWLRVDDLIWDYLTEVLNGAVRSTKGRYVGMGTSGVSNDDFLKKLFGKDVTKQEDLQDTAPILGQGVQDGLISYHAMPFHRYWFHRCRQVARNMVTWQNGNVNLTTKDWSDYHEEGYVNSTNEELSVLQSYYKSNVITPACTASITPHHSLVKDFLLCDGKKISSFKNYPNISLRNEKVFEIETTGGFAKLQETTDGFSFQPRTSDFKKTQSSYYLLNKTNDYKGSLPDRTPALFKLNEKYPRFIRGLNWGFGNEQSPENSIYTSTDNIDVTESINNNYYQNLTINNNTFYVHSEKILDYDEEGNAIYPTSESFNLDENGRVGIDIQKNITSIYAPISKSQGEIAFTIPHEHNIEYLTNVYNHYHLGFSSVSGGEGQDNLSKTIIQEHYRHQKYFTLHNDKCLWQNPFDFYQTRGTEWANYCLSNSNVFFDNYTPVPNIGAMIFNSQIYNPANIETGDTKSSKYPQYVGTIKTFQDNWAKSGYGYYDAQNNWYPLTEKHSIRPSLKQIKSIKDNLEPTDESVQKFRQALEQHKFTKQIRKQLAIKLNESEGRLPISSIGKAQFALFGKHFHQWKRRRSTIVKILLALSFVVAAIIAPWAYIAFLAWTTLICGTAGLGLGTWAADQLLKGSWRAAWSKTNRYGIGKYTFATFGGDERSLSSDTNQGSQSDDENHTSWQCVSSLPYDDPEYLGYGEITALDAQTLKQYECASFTNPEQYYVYHNVTDLWNAYNNTKTYSYGKSNNLFDDNALEEELPSSSDTNTAEEKIKIERPQNKSIAHYAGEQYPMEVGSPYPSFLNLLPIIRI